MEKFISRVCQWAKKGYLPKTSYPKLAPALRRMIKQEIPARDGAFHLVFRELLGSEGLRCYFYSRSTAVLPTHRNTLVVAAVMPYWRLELHSVSRDEYVQDFISWLFHFASQYVARSHITSALGALAFVYKRSCDDSAVERRYWSNEEKLKIVKEALETGNCSVVADRR